MAIGFYGPDQQQGLLAGATPDWQIKQQQIDAANTFKGGLPTDQNGNVDYTAAAKALFQKGAFADAGNLLNVGNQQRAIQLGMSAADRLDGGNAAPPSTGVQPNSVPQSAGPMPTFQKAISSVESGGNYGAQGPVTQTGDRAYGKYQVMGSNIGPWTKEILGVEMTPQQFLSSPQAQDAVFNGKFGQYLKQTGNPGDAASMWFTGRPLAQGGAGAHDQLGTSGSGYVSKFLAALPGAQTAQTPGQSGVPVTPPPNAPPASAGPAMTPIAVGPAGSPPNRPVQVAQSGSDDAPSNVNPYAPTPAAGTAPNAAPSNPVGGAPQPAAVPTPGQGASAPGVPVIDPTMGGLLKGQWVGNPGGYVSALRAQAVRLGTLGNTAAAQAYDQQASAVERGIERNNIVTNEMKDYAIAQQQGYQGTMMQYQQDLAAQGEVAKLKAQGDPSVIRAAGQKAQAEQDARNSSDVAAASQKGEQSEQGKALGQIPAQLASNADSARLQSNIVDEMLDASNQFRMGPGATTQQNLYAKLQALGTILHVDTSNINPQVASYQDFTKLAGQLARQAVKDTGSNRAGVQELQYVSSVMPSAEMSDGGFRTVATQLKGLGDFNIAKQQAAAAYGDPAGPGKGSLRGFDANWNANITPAVFVLHRMQIDQPQEFATTVSRMAQTAQGRAVLQKVKSGLTWANGQGLLD